MRNRLVIVVLVVILFGVTITVPSCGQGKQIAELEVTITEQGNTIAELEVTITEQGNTIAELQATVAEQSDTITEFQVTIAGLEADRAALQATVAEQSDTIANFEAEKEARLSQAQELYDFATEGLVIWEVLEETVTDGFSLLMTLWDGESVGNSVFMPLVNTINALENEIEWLYAPPNAYQVKDALLKQCDLAFSFVAYVSGADQARRNGDEDTYSRMQSQAMNILAEELKPLEDENRRDLINLQLQAEQDLK